MSNNLLPSPSLAAPPPPPPPANFKSQLLHFVSTSSTTPHDNTRDADDVDNDVLQSSIRKLLMLEPTNDDDDDDDDDGQMQQQCRRRIQRLGTGGLALEIVKQCHTRPSYERLARVIAMSIVAEWNHSLSLSSVASEGNDDAMDVVGDETSPTTTNLHALCHALCSIVSQSGSTSLLVQICTNDFLVHEGDRKDDSASTALAVTLREEFVSISQELQQAAMPTATVANTFGIIFTALSMTSVMSESVVLRSDITTMRNSQEEELLINVFLPTLSNPNNSFPTSTHMNMAHYFIHHSMTQSIWDERLAPILGLKLRAHPEKVLPLLESICSSLADTTITTTTTTPSRQKIDISSQLLLNEEDANHPNLLPSVIKHLKSAKASMRSCAWRTLILMAQLSGGENMYASASLITRAICDALLLTKGAGILSTPDQRAGAYAALEGIARYVLLGASSSSSGSDTDLVLFSELADAALVALTTCLPKEKITTVVGSGSNSADAVSLNPKDVGWNALVLWMQVSKLAFSSSLAKTTPAANGGGYGKALEYLAEPIVKYNVKDGEFRFRIGSLIMPPPSPYLLSIVGITGNDTTSATIMIGETFLESIASELIEKKKLVQDGLVTIIDAAVKKHATSDIVPQLDGVLAILLLVLHRNGTLTASSSSKFTLPASASKVLAAGGTEKGSSFLFSPSLFEAVRTETHLHYALHRIIALHCMATSNSGNVSSSGEIGRSTAVKCDEHPIVRLMEKRLKEGHSCPYSAATRALAVCVANPHSMSSCTSPSINKVSSIDASVETIVTYSSVAARAADAIVFALFSHVNDMSLKYEMLKALLDVKPNAVDEISTTLKDGLTIGSTVNRSVPTRGYEPLAVQSLVNALLPHVTQVGAMCRALVLTHLDTPHNLSSDLSDIIADTVLPFAQKHSEGGGMFDDIASFIAECAAASRFDSKAANETESTHDDSIARKDSGFVISHSIHGAATQLLATLGSIAGDAETECDNDGLDEVNALNPCVFASTLCVQKIPPLLASLLTNNLTAIEALTQADAALFTSPKGVLFRPDGDGDLAEGGDPVTGSSKSSAAEKRKAKIKGGGGFSAIEDEEWERQVKKDLEMKRKAQEKVTSSSSAKSLSPQDKELLSAQTLRREQISQVIEDFIRSLTAIRCLCEADIEVGNSILPYFGQCAIAASVSTCAVLTSVDGLKTKCFETLTALASCVYEIDEVHAPSIASALTISYQGADEEPSNTGKSLKVSALPSPCASAACSISEMVDYGDCLTANSFCFLFPIIRAALTGPKNIPGCDGALDVLERQCSMLGSENADVLAKSLRKDMASTVLELLMHDRSQTFVNPTPYEALKACYDTYETDAASSGPAFSAPELAPLISERGALGTENTRVASMDTLAFIAQKHPKLIISNPLIENRIWLNCFDSTERIRYAARRAWLVAHGHDDDVDVLKTSLDPPSALFAVPLMSLLSHGDASIANAAAASMAFAIGMHPDSAEKNIVKLCSTYISSFPAHGEDEQPTRTASILAPTPIVTKPVVKKVKKAPAMSSSLAKITGAPAPKKSAAMKKLLVKSVAPKQERTLDQSALMDQFKSKSDVKTVAAEEDSETKIAVRMGVLRAISSLTDAKVTIQLPLLKILIGFLLSFGLGDKDEGVRNASRNAARDIIANYGSSDDAIACFLPQFESVLKTGKVDVQLIEPLSSEKVPHTIAASDQRKEGVIVSLGSIALHLKDSDDERKIDDIIDMLLHALKTPSEEVQSSVALCLSKLMKKGRTQSRVESILNNLMMECIDGSSLASRRGAAYGISAAIKGSGIASLKKYDIVKRLDETCTSGSPMSKEGSLFCIELLSSCLGILFEPYVIVLLPALLKAFSDSNDHVRSAADKTVGLIMSNLSGHGVKLVMPAVLDAFDEPEWRTKQASIHMLGR